MPTYRITAPDGAVYEVEAPELATEQDALAYVQSQAQSEQPIDYANMPAHAVLSHAVSNAPKSALGVAKDVAEPFLHPIDTAKNLGHLAYGVGSKIADAIPGVEMDPEAKAQRESSADAIWQYGKDRYGSMAGFKKAVAEDPVGVLADATTALTGFGALAARAPGAVGRAGARVRDAALAVDPVSRGGQAVGYAVRHVVPPVQGMMSGQGARPYVEAFEAGRPPGGNAAFQRQMADTPGARTEVIDMAREGAATLRGQRDAQYRAVRGDVFAQGGAIDYEPINNVLAEHRARVRHRGPNTPADHPGHVIDTGADQILTEITAAVDEFAGAGNRLEDAHALRQRLGAIMDDTEQGTRARAAATAAYHAVADQIGDQAPNYAGMNQAYAQGTRDLRDLERTLSLGENALDDTTLRKLQSTMRNNAYTSWGHRSDLMDDLATHGGQPDLPPALAGQSLSQMEPRGLQRMVAGGIGTGSVAGATMFGSADPLMALPALALASPYLTGQATYGAGRAYGTAERILQRAGLPPRAVNDILYAAAQLSPEEKKAAPGESAEQRRKRLLETIVTRAREQGAQ